MAVARPLVCWGNFEGPHHKDVPLATILPTVLKAKPQGLLFETAKPRHGHEWVTVRDMRSLVPQDKVLIPGVLDTTTHFIAHPELITQRLQRFVDVVVGAERVIAGSDCGFGTFAGFGAVDEDIVFGLQVQPQHQVHAGLPLAVGVNTRRWKRRRTTRIARRMWRRCRSVAVRIKGSWVLGFVGSCVLVVCDAVSP